MKELLTLWNHTRMIVLVAFTAAMYAAVLIPFKAIPVIPGFAELRPALALPPTFSLLFGPAAAWGTAFGNLIGDLLGGTFSAGSAFGFVGNFLLGLVPYALWGRLGPLSSGGPPTMRSPRQWAEFAVILAVATLACAAVIGWGLELLRLFPYSVLGNLIFVNNFCFGLLAIPLLALLYPRVERWGLLWTDVMPSAEISRGRGSVGALLLVVGALGAGIAGNVLSVGVLRAPAFQAGMARRGDPAVVGTPLVVGGLAPFMLCLALGVILGRGMPPEKDPAGEAARR
jgi:energy-coupling factor transport system substrate-specific component